MKIGIRLSKRLLANTCVLLAREKFTGILKTIQKKLSKMKSPVHQPIQILQQTAVKLTISRTSVLAKLRRSDFSECEKKLLLEAVDHAKRNIRSVLECVANNPWLDNVKKALSKTANRAEKQVILTTLPHDWGVKKIQKMLGVSRHLASTAIKLRRDKGFSSSCDSKPGRPMHADSINEVQRVLPIR